MLWQGSFKLCFRTRSQYETKVWPRSKMSSSLKPPGHSFWIEEQSSDHRDHRMWLKFSQKKSATHFPSWEFLHQFWAKHAKVAVDECLPVGFRFTSSVRLVLRTVAKFEFKRKPVLRTDWRTPVICWFHCKSLLPFRYHSTAFYNWLIFATLWKPGNF